MTIDLSQFKHFGYGKGEVGGDPDLDDLIQIIEDAFNDGGGSIADPLDIGVINIADHLAFGSLPASSGKLRLGLGDQIVARDPYGNPFLLIGMDTATSPSVGAIVDNLHGYYQSAFTSFKDDTTTRRYTSFGLNGVTALSNPATSGDPTPVGGAAFYDYMQWWDGETAQEGWAGVYVASDVVEPHTKMVFDFSNDGNDELGVILDSSRRFYPDLDNSGSLGLVDKRWNVGWLGVVNISDHLSLDDGLGELVVGLKFDPDTYTLRIVPDDDDVGIPVEFGPHALYSLSINRGFINFLIQGSSAASIGIASNTYLEINGPVTLPSVNAQIADPSHLAELFVVDAAGLAAALGGGAKYVLMSQGA